MSTTAAHASALPEPYVVGRLARTRALAAVAVAIRSLAAPLTPDAGSSTRIAIAAMHLVAAAAILGVFRASVAGWPRTLSGAG